MGGPRTSHRPMVTTIAVMYPNGRMPTSPPTMPAKSIKSQALTKNSGPAAMSLKNASMIDHLTVRSPRDPAAGQVPVGPRIRDLRRPAGAGRLWRPGEGAGDHARDFGPAISDLCLYLKLAGGHVLKTEQTGVSSTCLTP